MSTKYDEIKGEIQSRLDDERLKSGERLPKNSAAASTLY